VGTLATDPKVVTLLNHSFLLQFLQEVSQYSERINPLAHRIYLSACTCLLLHVIVEVNIESLKFVMQVLLTGSILTLCTSKLITSLLSTAFCFAYRQLNSDFPWLSEKILCYLGTRRVIQRCQAVYQYSASQYSASMGR